MAAIDVPPLFSDTDFGPEMSLRIRVSGQVKGAEKDSQVSVCMIENFDKNKSSYQEYAPLAPETIYAPSDKWRDFAFEDIVNPCASIILYLLRKLRLIRQGLNH